MTWDATKSDVRPLPGTANPDQYATAQDWNDLVARAKLYDLACFFGDVPGDGGLLGRWAIVRSLTFPASLTGSVASAVTAATAQTVAVIAKNGTQVGTVTFAAAGTSGTFSSSGFSLTAGDILTITGPTPADATLAKISITLAGLKG